jgi:glycosyltransferase involved in cell wall biosynthesis
MNKIYFHAPHETWIVDRFKSEWEEHNKDISVKTPEEADTIWLCADWAYNHIPYSILKSKKVITTCHHFVDWEIDKYRNDMIQIDSFTHEYHVPCQRTKEQLQEYFNVDKPIHVRPFWVDPKQFYYVEDKASLRQKFGFTPQDYIIGSFQRDTQGVGIPQGIYECKKEKGADVFVEFVHLLKQQLSILRWHKPIKVLLGAWRRQYVMMELDKLGIQYKYLELPPTEVLNEMYNVCDLYVVGSRAEGAPMALEECAITKTPCISTNVGIAKEILARESIADEDKPYIASKQDLAEALLVANRPNVEVAYNNVQKYLMPKAFEWFRRELFGIS